MSLLFENRAEIMFGHDTHKWEQNNYGGGHRRYSHINELGNMSTNGKPPTTTKIKHQVSHIYRI